MSDWLRTVPATKENKARGNQKLGNYLEEDLDTESNEDDNRRGEIMMAGGQQQRPAGKRPMTLGGDEDEDEDSESEDG